MPTIVDEYRKNFARVHGCKYVVQLGRGRSLLPGVVITPLSVSDDGRTVTCEARMVDDANPAHLRVFHVTCEAIPARAMSVIISADDLGGFARWSVRSDSPVVAITA
jgi:hypothetical protein